MLLCDEARLNELEVLTGPSQQGSRLTQHFTTLTVKAPPKIHV
jgi:hypothetical protein